MKTNKFIKTVTHACVTLAFTATSLSASANEFMDSAKAAVEANKASADATASEIVNLDFQKTFKDVSGQLDDMDRVHGRFNEFLIEKDKLEAKLQDFANVDLTTLDMTTRELAKLRESYEQLNRERFDLSWVPTQLAEKSRWVGPILRQMVDRFQSTCESGRSDFSYDPNVPREPNPPPYYFDFMVTLNGDYPTANYKALNYGDQKTRRDIIQGASAVTSVSGSILAANAVGLAGASGTTLMCASYAFPIAGAALAVAMAVEHFSNMAKANKIAREISEAETFKFLNTKRDDYVAAKYRELCKEKAKRLARVAEVVELSESNSPAGLQWVAEQTAQQNAMAAIQVQLHEAMDAQCRLSLSRYARQGQCANPGATTTALCKEDSPNHFTFADPSPTCQVNLEKDKTYANEKTDSQRVADVDPEKVEQLTLHKITLALSLNRQSFLDKVQTTNWGAVDAVKERAFVKLLQFINLARRMNSKNLLGPAQIRDEINATRTFEGLRGRFIDVVATAIKVTFGKAAPQEYAQAVKTFEAQFYDFFRANRLNRDAQSLEGSLNDLKGIMNAKVRTL